MAQGHNCDNPNKHGANTGSTDNCGVNLLTSVKGDTKPDDGQHESYSRVLNPPVRDNLIEHALIVRQ